MFTSSLLSLGKWACGQYKYEGCKNGLGMECGMLTTYSGATAVVSNCRSNPVSSVGRSHSLQTSPLPTPTTTLSSESEKNVPT